MTQLTQKQEKLTKALHSVQFALGDLSYVDGSNDAESTLLKAQREIKALLDESNTD